jgi:hypothetical protein
MGFLSFFGKLLDLDDAGAERLSNIWPCGIHGVLVTYTLHIPR